MRPSVPNPFFVSEGLEVPYRDAVVCGDHAFLSGQISMEYSNASLLHEGDLAGQTALTMQRMGEILERIGFSPDDMVKVHAYVLGTDEDGAASVAQQAEGLPGQFAHTGVMVPSLIQPGYLVEIDALAVRGAGSGVESSNGSNGSKFPSAVAAGPFVHLSAHTAEQGGDDTEAELQVVVDRLRATLGEFDLELDRVVRATAFAGTRDAAAAVEAALPGLLPNAAISCLVVPSVLAGDATVAVDATAAISGPIERVGTRKSGAPQGVLCNDGAVLFVSAQSPADDNEDAIPEDVPEQVRAVMERLKTVIEECGGTMDHVAKQGLYYSTWDGWRESVPVRSSYYEKVLAGIAFGADHADPRVLVQSDAVVFLDD
ncbi:MAG: hypothetical protein QOH46_60 [Solirubrobacteraceae bacterium]|jgi:enamine deaminase RidA (YjgF/YER057c/UK114 family)|nr:hypothetical protein [Solirubrobacteraceae bacterium]